MTIYDFQFEAGRVRSSLCARHREWADGAVARPEWKGRYMYGLGHGVCDRTLASDPFHSYVLGEKKM